MTQNKKLLAGAIALVVAIAIFAGCYFAFAPKGTAGSKEISVSVTHADGSVNDFAIATSEEYLRGALEQEALVEGVDSDYGLYVLTVDGETADEANQEWWCFTKGGETVMTGVDTTPIADGDAYEITLVVGW